jgi:AcrR family transcriptional regulator
VLHGWLDRFSEIYDRYEPMFVTFQSAAESDTSIWAGASRVGERTNAGLQSKIAGSPLTPGQAKGVVSTIFEAVMRGNRRSAIIEAEWPETMGHRRAGLNIALADVFHRVLFGIDPAVNVHVQDHPPRPQVPASSDGLEPPEADPALSPAARRTRDLLVETSHVVFAERGFHLTRVDDIVDAAGVSHGIFYRYFDSKKEVFGLLATRAGRRMTDVLHQLDDLDAPPAEAPEGADPFGDWLRRYAGTYAEEGPIISTWVEGMSRSGRLDELSRDAVESGYHSLTTFLEPRRFGDVASEAVVMMVLLDTMCGRPPTNRRLSFFRWLLGRGLLTAPR